MSEGQVQEQKTAPEINLGNASDVMTALLSRSVQSMKLLGDAAKAMANGEKVDLEDLLNFAMATLDNQVFTMSALVHLIQPAAQAARRIVPPSPGVHPFHRRG